MQKRNQKPEEELILKETISALTEEDLIAGSRHKKRTKLILYLRNIVVGAAVFLLICALSTHPAADKFHAYGYFFGMLAYFFELLLLTDCFSQKIPHSEGFMVYCFGPLYFLMAIGYLLK